MAGGNPALEAAKKHWAERLAQPPRTIKVPEWGITGHIWPATLEERARYIQTEGLERAVDLVIVRFKDEDGKPIFHPGERNTLLKRVDPDVLLRLAAEILEGDNEPSPREAEEDFDESPASG